METYIFKSLKSDLVSVRCIDGWYHVVRLSKVVYVISDKNYCHIHIEGFKEPLRVRLSLAELVDQMLDDITFVKVNRSVVINVRRVVMYEDKFVKVLLNDEEVMLPISNKCLFLHFHEIN